MSAAADSTSAAGRCASVAGVAERPDDASCGDGDGACGTLLTAARRATDAAVGGGVEPERHPHGVAGDGGKRPDQVVVHLGAGVPVTARLPCATMSIPPSVTSC